MKGVILMKRLIRKSDGSITLEAAMVVPFFMFFILFLTILIRLAVADMALYKAAAETSEIVVAYAYPAETVKEGISGYMNNKIKNIEKEKDIDIEGATKWAKESLDFFGVDVKGAIENFIESLTADVLTPVVRGKFEQATGNWNFFNPDKLKVNNVEIPSLAGGKGEFLEINVQYEFDLKIPFVDKTLILEKTSYERIWNGS